MQNLFMEEHVFIRSVSSRGSLGGLSAHIIEMVEVLKHAPFDYIIVETVGVGQSEVEIAGIADTTVVVTVPESGDEIQALKSGIMEIADVFVVNNPQDGFLPKQRMSSEFVFAREQDFFVYPNNYNHFVNYYGNTFQHGGISMEEVLIPYIEMKAK